MAEAQATIFTVARDDNDVTAMTKLPSSAAVKSMESAEKALDEQKPATVVQADSIQPSPPTMPVVPQIVEEPASKSVTPTSSDDGGAEQQQPEFRRGLADSSLLAGRAAQLSCVVTGALPMECAWFVDGDLVVNSSHYATLFEDGIAVLRFNRAEREDEGEYVLVCENAFGRVSTRAYIHVAGRRRLLPGSRCNHLLIIDQLSPTSVELTLVPAGNTVTINCETSEEPKSDVGWRKDAVDVVPSEKFIFTSSDDRRLHTLTIADLSEADCGEFGLIVDGSYTPVTRLQTEAAGW